MSAAGPLAAVLAVHPVAPASPGKDYSGVWLSIVGGALLAIAVVLALLAWGWRGRRARQAGVPAPVVVPPAVLDQEPAAAAEGMFVGTVRGESRLDRIAVYGLGLRSDALVEVHAAGEHPGLLVLRPRMAPLFVPAGHLIDAGYSSGIAGKFTEPEGLLAWGWRLGDEDVTSAFRPRRAEDRRVLLDALQTIIDRAHPAPSGRAGQEDPR